MRNISNAPKKSHAYVGIRVHICTIMNARGRIFFTGRRMTAPPHAWRSHEPGHPHH
ncbi:hypothetical protein EMIT0196MI5_100142 [Pseudomonas sp. IT-196MI5]